MGISYRAGDRGKHILGFHFILPTASLQTRSPTTVDKTSGSLQLLLEVVSEKR